MAGLDAADIKYLHGVGPKRAELLGKELGVHTYLDLLYNFPFRYIDRTTVYRICDLTGDMPSIQLRGQFVSFTPQGEGAKRRLNALFSDGTGTIEVVWFNRVKSILESYKTHTVYTLFGKPTLYNGRYSISHPEVDAYTPDAPQQGLVGVYNLTEKLRNRYITSRSIQKMVATLLQTVAVRSIPDWLPPQVVAARRLMPLGEALESIHLPASVEALQRARVRVQARGAKVQRVLQPCAAVPAHWRAEARAARNPCRHGHRPPDEPPAAGRCGQRQDHSGAHDRAVGR